MEFLRRLLTSWHVVIACLLLGEALLNAAIIKKVAYTEIDWKAYMDEVSPVFLQGERNYTMLRGETGPLVYPGGFVWLYGALWKLTAGDVGTAQVVFSVFYLLFFLVASWTYKSCRATTGGPLLLVLLCLSKRIHSIFLLRLFNDGPTMLLLWIAFYLFVEKRFLAGCLAFSAALSVKMNALLVLPAVLLILVVHKGWFKAFAYLVLCAAFQVLVGYPFLAYDPAAYLGASFNFGRVFKQRWSVNFKWVPCDPLAAGSETLLEDCSGVFTSKEFGLGLLVAHLVVLSLFALRWVGWAGGVWALVCGRARPFTRRQTLTILLTVNFVGVAFARSLHFQFYVWYYHSLPFLIFSCVRGVPSLLAGVALFFLIEVSWNPWTGDSSTYESSLLLTGCHAALLLALALRGVSDPASDPELQPARKKEE